MCDALWSTETSPHTKKERAIQPKDLLISLLTLLVKLLFGVNNPVF